MKPRRLPSRAGTALVITLMALTLLAIIALALTASMRTARLSARSSLDKTRASLFSEQASNHAMALLRGISGATNRCWAVRPGEGYVASQSNNVLDTRIELSSGFDPTATGPDLNISSFTSASNRAIGPTNTPLRVQWIYVSEDGSASTAAPAAYNASNKVTGRYAFWVDNESSRVNWNTAWKRNTSGINGLTPGDIDLTVLTNVTPSLADQIHDTVKTNRFFNSPEEISGVFPDFAAAKFETTYFSHDPETTYWGAPRIVLTTQARLANGRPFLDILQTPNTDPGLMSAIDPAKLNTVLQTMVSYLGRNDWPVGPAGADFGAKFLPGQANLTEARQHELFQLAAFIIDYVRARESSQQIVQKIVGKVSGGAYAYTWNDDVNDITSLSRQPCLTEMGIYVRPTADPTTHTFWADFKAEIYLPKNYGLESIDLGKLFIKVMWWNGWYTYLLTGSGEAATTTALTTANTTINGNPATTLAKGQYAVVTVPVNLRVRDISGRPANLNLKAYLYTNQNDVGMSYVEEAPMITGYNNGTIGVINYATSGTDVPEANITSMEVDDPRVNKHNNDWKRHAEGTATVPGNTFGVANSISSLGHAPQNLNAEQDTVNGVLTDESFYMPAPKGGIGNSDGMVHSVAELGRVFTGGSGHYATGVPWRTVRLQPSSHANILPDWAMLDLFAAPSDPSDTRNTSPRLVAAGTGAVAGRINLNAAIAPFETTSGSPTVLDRIAPLQAALKGASLTAAYAQVAENIRLGTLAANGQAYGSSALSNRPFSLRGQVAEIRGVTDGGETTEPNLRDFVDLVTTQANVFRVYTIGQSLFQTKDNALKVTGERRDCRIIERLVPTAGGVQFRTVYQRDITF